MRLFTQIAVTLRDQSRIEIAAISRFRSLGITKKRRFSFVLAGRRGKDRYIAVLHRYIIDIAQLRAADKALQSFVKIVLFIGKKKSTGEIQQRIRGRTGKETNCDGGRKGMIIWEIRGFK